jgi:hypothetical protein
MGEVLTDSPFALRIVQYSCGSLSGGTFRRAPIMERLESRMNPLLNPRTLTDFREEL